MNEDIEQQIDQGIKSGKKVGTIIESLPESRIKALELILNKYGGTHLQEVREIADDLYEKGQFPHASCDNGLFYLAYKFGLADEKKKESALRLIINGMVGYFEPKTPIFDVEKLLNDLGVKIYYPECHYNFYTFLSNCSIHNIASKFGITNEELADCAYIACEFGLGKSYDPERSRAENRDAVSGSTPITLKKVKDLEICFLEGEKQKDISIRRKILERVVLANMSCYSKYE